MARAEKGPTVSLGHDAQHGSTDGPASAEPQSSVPQRAEHVARPGAAATVARKRERPWLAKLASGALIEQLLVWCYAIWVVGLLVRGHLPFVRFPYQQNIDEGYLLAIGQRMLHGDMLPFVDGVAHSGPLFLWSGALIAAFDEFSWLPVRIAAAIGFSAAGALTFACGRAGGRALAGAIGATAIPLFTLHWAPPHDGIAYNAELPAVLCALGAVYCALRALAPHRTRLSLGWLAGTGVLVTCAGMSKQIGALTAVPVTLYVLAAAWGRSDIDARGRRRMLAWYFGAAAVPFTLMLLWFAAHGALRDLYYYVVVYNRDIYMTPYNGVSRLASYRDWITSKPSEMAVVFGAMAWGCAQLFAARKETQSWAAAYHRAGLPLMTAQLAIAGVIGARASMRNFEHYYIVILPWLGLLAGLVADSHHKPSENLRERWWSAGYQAVLLIPLVVILELAMSARDKRLEGWIVGHDAYPNKQFDPPLCPYVREHSKPDDTIFVWGFRPEYYISCGRRPASRFVFTTFVAGFIPWDFSTSKEREDELAVPGSRALLVAELERTKPPLIIDAGDTIGRRSLFRYEELSNYVHTHYRLATTIGTEAVYQRIAP